MRQRSKERPARQRRLIHPFGAGGLAVAIGASALMLGAVAGPALASAANCDNTGTGYSSIPNQVSGNQYTLTWHQVWDKQTRSCTDFYLTKVTVADTYGAFYKDPSDSTWTLSDTGFVYRVVQTSDSGIDYITNVAIGTQLDMGSYHANNNPWNEYIEVKF